MKSKILKIFFLGSMLVGTLASCKAPVSSDGKNNDVIRNADVGGSEYSKVGATDFNEGWTFKEVTEAQYNNQTLRPYEPTFNDDSWKKVNLPYDWSIYKDYDPNVNSITGHLLGGYGWYRKKFYLPESFKGKHISITFNGVYMESTTYLNGEKLGFYPNGYVPFTYDLSSKLNFGDTPNYIAVSAVNTAGTSRWFSGAGIYRDVTLTVQEEVHIANNGTTINLPDLKKNHEASKDGKFDATASVVNEIKNESNSEKTFKVRTTLLDYKTQLPVEGVQAVEGEETKVAGGATVSVTNAILVHNPKLWSTDSPNLYSIKTELLQDGKVIETKVDRFGFRYFDWYSKVEAEKLNKSPAFYLNGKVLNFNGVCMHHDQGALGASAYKEAIFRQMRVMKEMGVNALRITHNVADPALLQACDELGLVAIEEFFDSWYTPKANRDFGRFFEKQSTHPDAKEGETWAEFDMRYVIKRDRNFPSIVMWSVGNEIPDSHDFNSTAAQEKAIATVKNLVKWAHTSDVDPNDGNRSTGQRRFVTIGQNPSNTTAIPIVNELDAVGYNYWFQYGNDSTGRPYQDNWRWYGSETSSAVKSRGFYAQGGGEQTKYAYVEGYGEQLSSWDNSSVGWGATASYELKRQQTTAGIGGEFVWTGFDYGGEPTPWYSEEGWKSPVKSYFGIVDTAGFAKDDYFLYQSQWRKVEDHPMVHIVSNFNWENETLRKQFANSDGTIPLKVYSNAAEVELFRQNPGEEKATSLGKKKFTQLSTQNGPDAVKNYQRSAEDPNVLYLKWDVDWNYAPGTKIFAKAYDKNGKEIASDKLNKTDYAPGLNVAQQQIVTAGEAYKVVLTPEKRTMTADGYDLIYIDASIVDKDGNFMPTAMNALKFDLLGDSDVAEIAGVDNGDSSSWERHKGYQVGDEIQWRRSAFNGRALAIVKAKSKAGTFSIQVTGDGLVGSTVTLFVKGETSTTTANTNAAIVEDKKHLLLKNKDVNGTDFDLSKSIQKIGE